MNALLAICLAVAAPQAVLYGPETAAPHALVVVDGRASSGDLKWAVSPNADHVVYDHGKQFAFCPVQPGDYTVVAVAKSGSEVTIAIHRVRVASGVAPNPGPMPPNPTPEPDIPTMVKNWCGKVTSPNVKKEATDLARVFETVARLQQEEAYESLQQFLSSTIAGAQAAVGENIEHWHPFLDELERELLKRKLGTLEQHAEVWKQIAKGLKDFANEPASLPQILRSSDGSGPLTKLPAEDRLRGLAPALLQA